MVPRPLDCSHSPPGVTGSIPADRAFAFLSKSFLDVRRGAETDLKLISSRTQSLKKIAEQLDDWENIKLPSVFPLSVSKDKGVTAGTLIRQIKDRSKELTRPLSIDSELDLFFKNWEQHVPPAISKLKEVGSGRRAPISLKPFAGRQFINLDDWNRAVKTPKFPLGDNWAAPLQRAVKEGLKELETAAAAAATSSSAPATPRSPTELIAIVKKKLTPANDFASERHENVRILDVPEVLESLARSSEVLLDHLGMDKGVASKVRTTIRSLRCATTAAAATDVDERVAQIMQSTGYRVREDDAGWWGPVAARASADDASASSKSAAAKQERRRRLAIVTTASLPWMTGTSVNPLLRAAYLAALGRGVEVTLLVPWLAHEEQHHVYPRNLTFRSPAEQEQYMRDWLHERIGFRPDMKIAFYPGRFSLEKRSILAVGDISSFIPDSEADVAVLEEPEHLTWYYHGRRWTDKFKHVVGIIHTNYLEYVRREKNGPLQAFLLEHVNNWMVRAYCSSVVRLSSATQAFPRASVCNVHGVGSQFLDVGRRMAEEARGGGAPFSAGAYYLGKMVWGKGYRELVDLLADNSDALGQMRVDVYGSGEDSGAVRAEAHAKGLLMQFHPGRDHAHASLHKYKVFINPSVSDVVCTTTAEALAMGKIVVCADHPSNDFFRAFPNCLIYKTPHEFVSRVREAMSADPQPLSAHQRHMLSWEAATERFIQYSGIEAELKHLLPATTASTSTAATAAAADRNAQLSAPAPSSPSAAAARLATRSRSCNDLVTAAAAASAGGGPSELPLPSSPCSSSAAPSPVLGALAHSPSVETLILPPHDEQTHAISSNTHAYSQQEFHQQQQEQGQRQLASSSSSSNSHLHLPSASLSLSMSAPDLTAVTDRFLSLAHFMASGMEASRLAVGALPGTMHLDETLSRDLGLPPPWAQRPSYGW